MTERKIFIGGVDKFRARTLQKREARKRADEERKRQAIDDRKSRERSRSFLSTSWEDEDNFLDTIPEPPPSLSQTQDRQDFPDFVATMQRYGISVRAGAALANSLLQDLGLANENNLLSRHKVSSMIEKHGGARAKEQPGQKNILCL